MSPKLVLGLAAATLVAALAAVAVVVSEPGTSRVELTGEPAFPGLRADPDEVDQIVIEKAGEKHVLRRHEDGGWTAETMHGYPALAARIRELVTGLADMRLVEPKTSNPERFARLEVEDVGGENATSRLVRLISGDGEPLLEVLIGKPRDRLTGTEPAGTYIRRVGEEQSWLASGRIDLPEEPALWLERRVIDLQREEVVRIEVEPPDGPDYSLRREEDRWVLADDGAELADDADPHEVAGALAALDLQGVQPVEQVAWPESVWRFRFVTEQGLQIALRLAEVEDGALWGQIEANASPERSGPAVRERAATISARTEGWAYRLPDRIGSRLKRSRSDWLDETS